MRSDSTLTVTLGWLAALCIGLALGSAILSLLDYTPAVAHVVETVAAPEDVTTHEEDTSIPVDPSTPVRSAAEIYGYDPGGEDIGWDDWSGR
jgi:hypothetical protein